VGIGILLFVRGLSAARELTTVGYFGDFFHLPFIDEAFVASRAVYTFLLIAFVLSAVLVTAGHHARLALFVAATLGVYFLLCDRLQFHHNRYALYCYAFLLSLSPCDRSMSISSPSDEGSGPLWAVRLAQVQCSIIYLASGGSKLLDPDWRGGQVLFDRFARYGYMALDKGVPQRIVDVFSRAESTSMLAKLAIGTELFLAFGLWHPRTRVFALWLGACFHLVIEGTSAVEGFTWLTLLIYGLFTTHDTRARKVYFDSSRMLGRVYAATVGALDWLARFEIKAWEPDHVGGHHIVVVRRDGSRATGLRAFAMVVRCCPALFVLWAPVALLASFTKGSDSSAVQ
jgi:Vitamin K-dependent gamma-carboxylase